jgi:hypothetical protein
MNDRKYKNQCFIECPAASKHVTPHIEYVQAAILSAKKQAVSNTAAATAW